MPPNPPDPEQYPSYQEATRFLGALDFTGRGQDAEFSFLTFDETDGETNDQLTTSSFGSLRDNFISLKRLNEGGAGVHVGIHETDGNGRTEENIVQPRAVFLDFDAGEPPRGIGALPVSMVVRSVRGPHVYWLLAPGEDLAEWRRVQEAMAGRFGSDASATTLTQTMRMPGFLHRKAEPRPVYIEMLEGGLRYHLADFVRAFQLQPELEAIAAAEAELAKRKEEARSLAPTRPVGSYAGRVDRALAFIRDVPGVQSHRNDHIASKVAPIGYSFGVDEHEWEDQVVQWAADRGMIAHDFKEKEVRQCVRSMYRRLERKGAEPFGWRLEQDSPEWREKKERWEASKRERAERDDASWAASLAQADEMQGARFDDGFVPPRNSPRAPFRAAQERPGTVTARDAMAPTTLQNPVKLLDLTEFNYLATPPVPDGHPLSLRGNAQRFINAYSDQVRYSPLLKDWFLWDGRRWEKDESLAVYCLAQQVVASLHDLMDHKEVKAHKDDSDDEKNRKVALRDAIKAHVKKSETPKGIKDLMEYASWQRSVIVKADALDADDLLFNTDNGVVDVRSLDLGPHNPKLYQTKVSPVGYAPKARCPTWEGFLDWCMKGDQEMIRFLQRAAGYSLTGSVREQVFFVCFGTGGNGKSTFVNTLMEIGAGYARQCSFDMFLASATRSSSSPNEELLALKDVRLAFASEPDEGARLKEDLIKQITGGERISARPLWGKPIEFYPKFTLWFSCNHRPAIRGTDNGIWRRVLLIPWLANIEETPDKKDTNFAEKLVPEYEGILAWAMAGAHEWYRNGLQIPDRIRAATRGYRDEMDTLGDFLRLKTITAPKAMVGSSELYRAYCDWCEETHEKPWKHKTFSQRVRERGFQTKKTRAGNAFVGIGLRDFDHDDDELPPKGQQELGGGLD